MKQALAVGIILLMFFIRGTSFGNEATKVGSYPLPLIETEVLLTRWLQQEKYSVASQTFANGDIVLRGTTSGKHISVSMRSHSSLATEIELLESSGKNQITSVRASWESFLARSGLVGGRAIPEGIVSLANTVVCISAPAEDKPVINFSGFLINQRGTILTIAHDIDDRRVFKLLFPGGELAEGYVTKSDVAKDLSVMQSDHRGYSKFVSLKDGRSKLKLGDRVFMLCCSSNGSIQIQAGTVDKPKATVEGQPLWQVNLEQIFFGSSGSPVVDENGRLVGVVKGRYRGTDSRGFLIPLDTVRTFVGMGKK